MAFYRYFQQGSALDSAGFDLIQVQAHVFDNSNARRKVKLPNGELTISLRGNQLQVQWRDQQFEFPISDDRIRQLADAPTNIPQLLDLQSGDRRIRLIIQNINGERLPAPKITNISFALLLRSQDWL